MVYVNEYGAMARQKRKEMGLSMSELAEKVGVSKNTISRFELGRNVTWQNVRMILNALEIEVGDEYTCDLNTDYPPNSFIHFSSAIRSKRIYLSWTVEMLAKQSGVSVTTIYEIERGIKDAYLSTYLRLFKALGIHVEFFDENNYINYQKSRKS